jgi:hypothetical protein
VVRGPPPHSGQPDRTLHPPRQGARLLEAGCGTGGNLAMLSRYGALEAFEFDAGAVGRRPRPLRRCALAPCPGN